MQRLEVNKDPSEWSGDELKTMLKSAMGGDGFSKYNTKPEMLDGEVLRPHANHNQLILKLINICFEKK